jgi:ribose transport system ATP-binding protein
MRSHEPLLRVEHIFKTFGVTHALRDVSLKLEKGQVLGLVGENGSGKSTLASIIARIQTQDKGEMFFDGASYNPRSAIEANALGICMILQEKGTLDHLSVARNIFIGKEQQFSKWGLLNNKEMIRSAQKALEKAGVENIQADVPLKKLGFEDRKLIELARAVYSDPQVLIVDETTTALSKRGRDVLYAIIANMRSSGKSVIFISHDIDEMIHTCDEIVVLRDGVYIDSLQKEQFGVSRIKSLMVGREIAENYYRTDQETAKGGDNALVVDHLNVGAIRDVSLTLLRGEILGIAGLTDCGMHDLGKAAFGAQHPRSGTVKAADRSEITNPQKAMRYKIAYISKDRDQEALIVNASITDNICLPSYTKLKHNRLIFPMREKQFVSTWAGQLNIKMRDRSQFVMELSGGNKQKVALAKWLGFGADTFILDCPTRGIDVGVKATIYQLMMQLRAMGKSILLISEELTEVIGMSDRVITIKNGVVSGEFTREHGLTENDLIERII